MPSTPFHWQQLEDAGLRSRFSCCYAYEAELAAIPSHWRSERVALPDHRRQEELEVDRLVLALNRAESLLLDSPPLYLHCLAGIERSPLIAIGLTARVRHLSLFDSLDWVRRCHPASLPIYSHLELLEVALNNL
jgi:protein-tyrosine phosphatase